MNFKSLSEKLHNAAVAIGELDGLLNDLKGVKKKFSEETKRKMAQTAKARWRNAKREGKK